MRAALVSLLTVACATAGCGYVNPNPHTRARATAEAFVESCARGYPDRAIDMLTNGLRPAFIGAGSGEEACARLLGVPVEGRDGEEVMAALEAARLTRVDVHGARATATVARPGGEGTFELGFFEDAWKVQGPASRLASGWRQGHLIAVLPQG